VVLSSPAIPDDLPDAVREGLARLSMDGIHFAPVRHHSPACALALQAMVRELRPAMILIEGPDSFDALLPLLRDARTIPPVAILSQAGSGNQADGGEIDGTSSAFFPFCAYSPEWVALELAAEVGAQATFIDLPWHARREREASDSGAGSLMAERYLAHSTYLRTLAAAAGCRDQDELWDRLFELRTPAALRDWRGLFADVFAYCAMARNDYETDVLEAEGSLPRERHMATHLRQRRAALAASGKPGPIVVVTGGFHTIALQQLLDGPAADAVAPAAAPTQDWLVRYSFDRLDALNGYAAGMPSPAWYQWVWESAQASADGPHPQQVTADALVRFAQATRERGWAEQVSTADVQAALLQANRLAWLRGHAGPGRQDLLDAVRTCFVKGAEGDGTAGFAGDLRSFLGGSTLGDVPPSAGSPPLLEDARRHARAHRIRLDDSTPRTARLDIYRKDRHRLRSRFLHLMDYLGAGLGAWRGGPDFAAGTRLELLIEEWEVAWTPLVEARLIEIAAQGTTLAEAALGKLRREETALGAHGQARSARAAVALLVRACLIGLHDRLPALLSMLGAHLDEDSEPASVIACAHQLLTLWRAREPMGLQDNPQLAALLQRTWSAALYLLPRLAQASADTEREAVRGLVSLRAFFVSLRDMLDAQPWRAALERLASAAQASPGVAAAAAAMLFLDGDYSEDQLARAVALHFGAGGSAEHAVRALSGVMAAAPELVVTQRRLRDDLDQLLRAWDEATFLAYLPDLRHAFAQLKPRETAELAGGLASMHSGLDAALGQTHYGTTEADLLAGSALQLALAECLARDGLGAWLQGGEA
jgi:hypothetical protein